MAEPLTYRLDRRYPIAVVRLAGALTPRTAPLVSAAAREALTEEPSSVIVDLAGLVAVEDAALPVLTDAAAQAADWPGIPILLSAPPADVGAALERASVAATLPVFPTFQEALAVAAADPVPWRAQRRLEPTVDAPREARDLATGACRSWGVPEAAAAAEVVASELVTNVVRHAGTPMELRLTLQQRQLRVSVRDGSERLAHRCAPTESDNHGRGLLIVESVARSWGNVPLSGGKVVWALLRTPARGQLAQ